MDGVDLAAAIMTVLLVAAGVIVATMVMNRFGDLLPVLPEQG